MSTRCSSGDRSHVKEFWFPQKITRCGILDTAERLPAEFVSTVIGQGWLLKVIRTNVRKRECDAVHR